MRGDVQARITHLGVAVPAERFSQQEVYELIGYRSAAIRKFFLNTEIGYRHLYRVNAETAPSYEDPNFLLRRFTEGSVSLAKEAIERCLGRAGIEPRQVEFLAVATSTGYVCPGLSARLMGALEFPHHLQHTDIVGHGCAGALPALQRAGDFARANGGPALAVAVEVCSAAYYKDASLETVIGNALCADGAAAALLAPSGSRARPAAAPESRGATVLGFASALYPEYLGHVGFDTIDGRHRIRLSKELRTISGPVVQDLVKRLLDARGVEASRVARWVLHPGGVRVIESIKHHLGLRDDQLAASQHILYHYGNMSSPTVLFVLERVLGSDPPRPGELGVMAALGPGLCAEGALLQF
ncbi:MAG: hypothetical protein HYY96_02310 [Candidatus Tectomicrobia bacterium]|nr:hypothetical protein [Candidatus Tectomicrobia bacterium]